MISIRGRRPCPLASRPLLCYFNPRLREGGDAILRDKLDYLGEDFNPRLREGGDCINYQFLHLIQSIPCIDHPSGTSN